jgi:hypothetical protein
MKRGFIAIIHLSACSGQTTFDYETPVKRELRDPDSAQFSDVTVNVESACGFVNSKNGYGGFAGKTAFVVVGRDASMASVTIISDPTEDDVTLVNSRCLDPAKSAISDWMRDRTIEALRAPV